VKKKIKIQRSLILLQKRLNFLTHLYIRQLSAVGQTEMWDMPYANGEAIGFYMAIAFTASIKTLLDG